VSLKKKSLKKVEEG